MFAVTGITGKVGAAVARSLLSADQPVRAVIRDRSKGTPWAQLGCDIAVADQMIDGFNAGWIDFPDRGAHARKGSISIDQAIATLIS